MILDNVANHSLADCRRVLTSQGILLTNNGTAGNRWIGPLGRMAGVAGLSLFVGKQKPPFYAPVRKSDLVDLKEMIESGKITSVIGRTFSLSETAEAMGHVGEGHARGKVAITVREAGSGFARYFGGVGSSPSRKEHLSRVPRDHTKDGHPARTNDPTEKPVLMSGTRGTPPQVRP